MQAAVLAVLLAAVFALFLSTARTGLRVLLQTRPGLVWAVPFLLTAMFWAGCAAGGALIEPALAGIVLVYTLLPVSCLWFGGGDFLAVALLWLPIEFAGGVKALVPSGAQGFVHSVAYGIAILLGLIIFLGYRGLKGMKYNPPRHARDWWLPLLGFAIVAPVLIGVGIPIGFIPPAHLPGASGGKMAAAFGLIFAGTAIPEEILFRSLIQNLVMQRWGESWKTLLIASFIFGCAHLDNGPQPLPNWRYMILATIAGVAYGRVFQRSSTVVSSALLHTLVDWTKHFFF